MVYHDIHSKKVQNIMVHDKRMILGIEGSIIRQ
jgi:hypothetical protein